MTASVCEGRLGVSELLGIDSGLAVNVWNDAWISMEVDLQVLLPFVKDNKD